MPAVISNSAESLSIELFAPVSIANCTPNSRRIATTLVLAFPSLWDWRTAIQSRVVDASSCRQSPDDVFCLFASSRFDSRLYSGTGLGHIRRPAALGLLLRCAPYGFGSSRNKFAPRTAQSAERISFGSLRKSRPLALGSRAHSRGFAMRAPSQFGSSKRRNRHVSEQNHAHRFPR